MPAPQRVCQQATASYSRGDTTYLLTLGGIDQYLQIISRVDRYTPQTGLWEPRAPLPVGRTLPGSATLRGLVYIAGGYLGGFSASNRLDIYTPQTNSWQVGPPLLAPVGDCATATVGDSLLYLIGGTSVGQDVQLVQVYNVRTRHWAMAIPKPGSSGAGIRGAGVSGGRFLVAGGYNQMRQQTTAEAWLATVNPLDGTQLTWTALPDNPAGGFSRLAAGSSPLPGNSQQAYFVGGNPTGEGAEGLSRLWVLDADARSWKAGPDMPTGVSNLMNLVPLRLRDSVYLATVGGYTGSAIVATQQALLVGRLERPLPVELVSFSATLKGGQAILNWQTATERLNASFQLESSQDGHQFTPVAMLPPAAGSSTMQPQTYQWRQTLERAGLHYYRLSQLDLDGKRHFLGIRVIASPIRPFQVSIYPNPVTAASAQIQVSYLPVGSPSLITLIDALGRTQVLFNSSTDALVQHVALPSTLLPGIYSVRSEAGTQQKTLRFLKQ